MTTSKQYKSDSYLSQTTSSQLARLMSQENLLVEFNAKDETASFNITDRTLRLPVYKNMTEDEVNLFIGHEISHAINTGKEYLDNMTTLQKAFKLEEESAALLMNVVEDVRIEKLIKRRYPGLKKDFYFGYQDLVKRIPARDSKDTSSPFVDRFNHHFKFGHFIPTAFTPAEQAIVDEADKMETADDVLRVAEQIATHYKNNKLFSPSKKPQSGPGSPSKGNGDPYDGQNMIPSNDGEMGFVKWGQSNTEAKPKPQQNSKPSAGSSKPTQKVPANQHSQLEGSVPNSSALYDHSVGQTNTYIDVPIIKNLHDLIISNDKIAGLSDPNKIWECDTFISSIRPLVSLLASIFNRKKQATEFRRVMRSESGSIDTHLLTQYKFVDNIFKTFSVTKKGKKHGVVMYLDWSGSMSGTIHNTVKQAIIVMELCRRINIPFELFAFSNSHSVQRTVKVENKVSSVAAVRDFRLLNFVSSSASLQQYKKSLYSVWAASKTNGSGDYPLSGTPLNEALFHAFSYIPAFKRATKSELVSLVVLSDGDSDSNIHRVDGGGYTSYLKAPILRHRVFTYKAMMDAGTDAIVKAIRDIHKVNAVCFFIRHNKQQWSAATTELERQGFNERIFISPDSMDKISFGADIQKDKAGKVLLDRFITLIAEKYHDK